MRKIIIYISVLVFWLTGVILFCNLGKTDKAGDDHEFTVLSEKKATGESPHFHAVPHICRPATATTQD